MKTAVIIPARYASTRFPGKPLTPLLGKPMILWVAELSAEAVGAENVYVATEDSRIADVVQAGGFQAVMTSAAALTGTDRLAEAAKQIDADVFVNVQGDEPTLDPQDIVRIRDRKLANPDCVINGYCAVGAEEDPTHVNLPKVVMNEQGKLIYMSRAAIPGHKDPRAAPAVYFKQVCIYAFTRQELAAFLRFGRKSTLEACEDIEILRFLDLNVPVLMVETAGNSLAVDDPRDVAPVERRLAELHKQ